MEWDGVRGGARGPARRAADGARARARAPRPAAAARPAGPAGVGQQLLFLVGLFAPLEAVTRRTDVSAVVAALVFAALHVPFNLPANGGDLPAAFANAVFYQASAGLIACLAFVRHRAPVPIGAVHAAAIA